MEERAETKIKPRTIGKNVELPGLTWRNVLEPGDVEKVRSLCSWNFSVVRRALVSPLWRSHAETSVQARLYKALTHASTAGDDGWR
jgi:hypothetical protein